MDHLVNSYGTEVERACEKQEGPENQQDLLPTNAAGGTGGIAPESSLRRRPLSWVKLNLMSDSTQGDLIRRITILERSVLITVLAIVIIVLAVAFGVSKARQLSEERVQTIYVQSSVDLGKDSETQGRHPCDDGWIWYRSKCYYFSVVEGTWTMANDSCTTLNSLLAVIDNQLELDFVVRQKGVSDHWIGLKKDSDGTWKWCNGIKFNNWFKINESSECAFLNYHPIRSGECFSVRKWICTKVSSYERGRKNRPLELMTQSFREHFIKP